MNDNVRVLIIDDDKETRTRLCTLVNQHPGFVVVGLLSFNKHDLQWVNDIRFDVVLIKHPNKDEFIKIVHDQLSEVVGWIDGDQWTTLSIR